MEGVDAAALIRNAEIRALDVLCSAPARGPNRSSGGAAFWFELPVPENEQGERAQDPPRRGAESGA